MQELAKPEPDADAEAQAFELAKPQADAEPQPMEHLGQQGQRPSLHRQTRSPSLLGHAPDLGQQGQGQQPRASPSLLVHLGQDSAGKVDVATQRAAAKRQQLPVRNQWQHGQRPRRKDRSAIAKISKSRQ